jgi:hypothetical protein
VANVFKQMEGDERYAYYEFNRVWTPSNIEYCLGTLLVSSVAEPVEPQHFIGAGAANK